MVSIVYRSASPPVRSTSPSSTNPPSIAWYLPAAQVESPLPAAAHWMTGGAMVIHWMTGGAMVIHWMTGGAMVIHWTGGATFRHWTGGAMVRHWAGGGEHW